MSLVLLNDYKEILNIETEDEDEFIGLLSQEVETFVKTYLNQPIESNTYTEIVDGNGNNVLILEKSPIISVSKIEVYEGRDTSGEIWRELTQDNDYERLIVKDNFIMLIGGTFLKGDSNYRVTYVAGYEECPGDIQLACKKLVKLAYDELKKSNSIGRASVSQSSGYTANLSFEKDEVGNILKTISYYRFMNV